jgi:DNA uptake protein ComE-like DNA-binding protein
MTFKKTILAVAALSFALVNFTPAHAQDATPAAAPAVKATTTTKTTTATKTAPAASAAKVEKVDINTATKEQLMALPGIGDAIADKIIAGRPFANKHQLVDKGMVNKGQYAKMTSHIIASGGMASSSAKPAAKTAAATAHRAV